MTEGGGAPWDGGGAKRTGRISCGPCDGGRIRRGGIHLEAPADLEVEALVDRLGGGKFLALGFYVQGQARHPGPAGAEAVGAGRAIREHRAHIGGQEAGAEGRGDAIADFGVQAAGWGRPGVLGRQARGGLPGPEAFYPARRGAPGWGERQGEALARGAGINPNRARGAPFLVVAVFVGEQASYRRFKGQAQGRVRILHPAAQFEAEPGLGIAPVMPDAQLHGRGHALAFRPRDRPAAFQDQPQPVRLRVRRGEARDGARRRAREHGVRARGQLEAPMVRRREQEAPAAEGPHQQRHVRLQGAAGPRLQGQVAPPVAQDAPHLHPLINGIAQVGMETGQGTAVEVASPVPGERAASPAVGDRHAGQPAGPFAIHPHGAREHVPVQGQRPVAAVELGAGHPAPGGQAQVPGCGVVIPEGEPEGTAQQDVAQADGGELQGLGWPQARVRLQPVPTRVRPVAARRGGQPQGPAHQPRQQGGQPVRGGRRLHGVRVGGARGVPPQRQPVAAHRHMGVLPRHRAQPLAHRVRDVGRHGPAEPRRPGPERRRDDQQHSEGELVRHGGRPVIRRHRHAHEPTVARRRDARERPRGRVERQPRRQPAAVAQHRGIRQRVAVRVRECVRRDHVGERHVDRGRLVRQGGRHLRRGVPHRHREGELGRHGGLPVTRRHRHAHGPAVARARRPRERPRGRVERQPRRQPAAVAQHRGIRQRVAVRVRERVRRDHVGERRARPGLLVHQAGRQLRRGVRRRRRARRGGVGAARRRDDRRRRAGERALAPAAAILERDLHLDRLALVGSSQGVGAGRLA